MKKFINNNRYLNSLYIIFSLICIIFGINIKTSSNISGIRIFASNIAIYILLFLSLTLLLIEVLILILGRKINFGKTKQICFIIVSVLFILVILDSFVLGIVRSFVTVTNIDRKITSEDPLNLRLAYICLNYYSPILNGVWTTIWLSLVGTLIGLIIALIFVCLRSLEVNDKDNEFIASLKVFAKSFVNVYVNVFRGTPMMVQAIIIYYFLPGLLASLFNVNQDIINNILSVSVSGLITVSLNTAAYLTEVLRGGIEALNKGQMEAARSLGMTRTKAMIYVILPQGIKNSLPSICNEFIINIKDTSVLSVISVMDLFFIIDKINGKNASQDAIFIAAIIYLVLTFGISKLLTLMEKRMNLVSKPLPSCN